MKLNVPDMSCGHCVATITKAVKGLDASAEVNADLAAKQVTVKTGLSAEKVMKALDDAGYPASAG